MNSYMMAKKIDSFFIDRDTLDLESILKTKFNFFIIISNRIVLFAFCATIAIFFPDVENCLNFIGCVFTIALGFCYPIFMYHV